jgi:hypothetical protein
MAASVAAWEVMELVWVLGELVMAGEWVFLELVTQELVPRSFPLLDRSCDTTPQYIRTSRSKLPWQSTDSRLFGSQSGQRQPLRGGRQRLLRKDACVIWDPVPVYRYTQYLKMSSTSTSCMSLGLW